MCTFFYIHSYYFHSIEAYTGKSKNFTESTTQNLIYRV